MTCLLDEGDDSDFYHREMNSARSIFRMGDQPTEWCQYNNNSIFRATPPLIHLTLLLIQGIPLPPPSREC